MFERRVENAARLTLGSVPSSWDLRKISERLSQLAPLRYRGCPVDVPEHYQPPPSTYLLWLRREKGISYVFYPTSVLKEENIDTFQGQYPDMAKEARLTAELDVANFAAELEITPLNDLLLQPVLSISLLYRYIAAQEQSMEFLLSDDMILKAINELRANPYLFFAYGENAQKLMPSLWEDL